MQVSHVLLFFSACIIGAIFLYWIIPLIRKRMIDYQNNARKVRIINDLLNRAIGQRSKFNIEVTDGELKGFAGEGICAVADGQHMEIEIADTFAAQQLQDCHCRIFFQVIHTNTIGFFHFSEKCINVSRRGAIAILTFVLPSQLESGQKRKTLRCKPPQDAINAIGVWGIAPDQPLPTKKDDIKDPIFTYQPRKQNVIALKDISAGGMHLLYRPKEDNDKSQQLKVGSHVLCLLMLNIPQTEKKILALWASCRVVSQSFDEKEKIWSIGLSFVTWAGMDEGKSEIIWFPNDENGSIPILAPVILRWNMQQNKKSLS